MSWSPQQDRAIAAVKDWLADPFGKQVFRLFGYAGTGKTTLAKELAASVEGLVLYATFTGKASLVLRADQLLCGFNRTRTAFNRRIRKLKGLQGEPHDYLPVVGDRLICLRNNRQKHLFNGGLWEVDKVADKFGRIEMNVSSLDEERDPVSVQVFEEFFCGKEASLEWRLRRECEEFTFGWAITCHKSQGSQWDDVIVFDESGAFRESRANWLYTAVTRAADRVTVVI